MELQVATGVSFFFEQHLWLLLLVLPFFFLSLVRFALKLQAHTMLSNFIPHFMSYYFLSGCPVCDCMLKYISITVTIASIG